MSLFQASFWAKQRVIVTGGGGFLGSHVVEALKMRGCEHVLAAKKCDYDLRDQGQISRLIHTLPPTIMIHLAATAGGIGANKDKPGQFFYDNMMMGMQIIHACRQWKVPKLVLIGTASSYPKSALIPFMEETFWDGLPDESMAPYGIAKKALLIQALAYRKQYGLNSIYLIPTNLYGPRDNFDLETSHLVPAVIRKVYQARKEYREEIVFWGSGTPTRDLLFVEDCAEAILLAAEHYDGTDPVNIGTGSEISISALVWKVCNLCGYKGEVRWDDSMPDGQSRRLMDVAKARDLFGFKHTTGLEDGLRKTIEWWRNRP